MDFVKEEFWGILLNITGSCLWAITILFLFMHKVKEKRKKLKDCRIAEHKKFDEEVFSQLIKQQTESAFNTISLTIRNERRLLAELIENGKLKKMKNNSENLRIDESKLSFLEMDRMEEKAFINNGDDRYAEVLKLADRGMSTRKISEKVKIPKGEIEMLVSLRSRRRRHAKRMAVG